jgi:glycosyltransferase involved in cell wall biosynthesis
MPQCTINSVMVILHIGYGISPFWDGGYIAYLESLLDIQHRKGYRIDYLFSRRSHHALPSPSLVKWRTRGCQIYEIVNTTVINGPWKIRPYPSADLQCYAVEELVRKVLRESQPDIVHIQHLMGLPTNIISIIKNEYHIPVVMTLHDYYMLCPKGNLFNDEHTICSDHDISHKCAACLAVAPSVRGLYPARSLLEIKSYSFACLMYKVRKPFWILKKKLKQLGSKGKTISYCHKGLSLQEQEADASLYQQWREINSERLKTLDWIICASERSAHLLRHIIGPDANVCVIPHGLQHFEKISLKTMKPNFRPLRFVTLTGFSSIAKGAELLRDALLLLKKKRHFERFELHAFGSISECVRNDVLNMPNVICHGQYKVHELNRLLEGMHVGIVPSIWEEPFGIVTAEILATGTPIIGTNRGGIADLIKNGKTGWLISQLTPEELAEKMESIIIEPEKIMPLHQHIVENLRLYIKSGDDHAAEIDFLYRTMLQCV